MNALKYILLSFIILCSSCDDFLDVRPEGEVVNDELFKDAQGFEDALYGVYSFLNKDELYGKNLTFYVNDVAAQYLISNDDNDPSHQLCNYNYKHQYVRPLTDTIWVMMYKNIANVNNILVNLEKKDPASMRLYNVYKAECLGLRAFMHFELLRLYTDDIVQKPDAQGIPYYTDYSFKVEPFEPSSETYKKILADLTEAENLFLENGEYFDRTDDEAGEFILDRPIHMNLYAIEAVMARVYWTMGNWAKAKEYALKVINCGFFTLEDKTQMEDLCNGVLSPKETIFGLFSLKWPDMTQKLCYSSGGSAMNLQSNYEDIYAEERDGVDYRWEGWIKNISDYGAEGIRLMKIVDRYKVKLAERPVYRISGINLIRLPEMYYIVAECCLQEMDNENAATECRSYFDKVIVSRGLNSYAQRGLNVYLKEINIERRKEFIGEGLYFHVMKKYGMEAYNPSDDRTFPASSEIYNYPIPDSEFDYRN